MTTPSNSTFYQWGYHDPGKDPILPLSDDQKKILERVITVDGGTVRVGSELLPSGEGFDDPSRFYNIALAPCCRRSFSFFFLPARLQPNSSPFLQLMAKTPTCNWVARTSRSGFPSSVG